MTDKITLETHSVISSPVNPLVSDSLKHETPVKSDAARLALRLMDSDIYDVLSYCAIVKLVSNYYAIPLQQLESELEPFI